jgi:hypothetical protein
LKWNLSAIFDSALPSIAGCEGARKLNSPETQRIKDCEALQQLPTTHVPSHFS